MRLVAFETFPTHTVGWNAVPEEWEDEQPERFNRVVKGLHDAAEGACDSYDALVKLATRKLGTIPALAQPKNSADAKNRAAD